MALPGIKGNEGLKFTQIRAFQATNVAQGEIKPLVDYCEKENCCIDTQTFGSFEKRKKLLQVAFASGDGKN